MILYFFYVLLTRKHYLFSKNLRFDGFEWKPFRPGAYYISIKESGVKNYQHLNADKVAFWNEIVPRTLKEIEKIKNRKIKDIQIIWLWITVSLLVLFFLVILVLLIFTIRLRYSKDQQNRSHYSTTDGVRL